MFCDCSKCVHFFRHFLSSPSVTLQTIAPANVCLPVILTITRCMLLRLVRHSLKLNTFEINQKLYLQVFSFYRKFSKMRQFSMLVNVLFILFILFLIFWILNSIYIRLIYPIRQFFKKKNEFGYVLTKDGQYEHRVKVEAKIGRLLEFGEEVHHINGKPWDNHLSNLALMSRENHRRWHGRLEWMYKRKMFPKIRWQKRKLIEEFDATLF